MKIEQKILWALSFSALTLCTYNQQVYASDTDVEILNYVEDQRREARDREKNKAIIEFKEELDAEYTKDGIVIDDPQKAPIIFEGNDIMYNSMTGEVYGKGNVKITQNYSRMTTEDANGNLNTGDVDIPTKSHMLQVSNPTLDINSDKTKYNYNEKTGVMDKVKGRIDNRYVSGEQVEFFPDYYVIYNGTMTRCPAQKPDYALTADKIEIYPDDHMVAYNAKFLIKGKVIYQTDEYRTSIGANSDDSSNNIPVSIRINDDDGLVIGYNYRQGIAKNVGIYADLKYTTKHDMKNIYGIGWNNAGSSFRVENGKYEDDDDNWLEKDIAYIYNYGQRIGKGPFGFNFYNEYGLWEQNNVKSWHREHGLTLYRDPIMLDSENKIRLYPSIGYKLVYEDYNNSQSNYNNLYYDLTLLGELSDNLVAYTGYHYSRTNVDNTLFDYNTADYSKKVSAGLSYTIDDKNRIVVATGFDASDNLYLRDLDYYWYHDWHCVQTELKYEQKEEKWSLHFNFLNF